MNVISHDGFLFLNYTVQAAFFFSTNPQLMGLFSLYFADASAPGDASKPFAFQFGSISPGFVNGMQVNDTIDLMFFVFVMIMIFCIFHPNLFRKFPVDSCKN